jgi:hypothetical protein
VAIALIGGFLAGTVVTVLALFIGIILSDKLIDTRSERPRTQLVQERHRSTRHDLPMRDDPPRALFTVDRCNGVGPPLQEHTELHILPSSLLILGGYPASLGVSLGREARPAPRTRAKAPRPSPGSVAGHVVGLVLKQLFQRLDLAAPL